MLEAKDPKMSIVSLDSAALDRINQRNADRLAKLENQDEINGSAFFDQISVASLKSRGAPRQARPASNNQKIKAGLPPRVKEQEQKH